MSHKEIKKFFLLDPDQGTESFLMIYFITPAEDQSARPAIRGESNHTTRRFIHGNTTKYSTVSTGKRVEKKHPPCYL